ncbi:AzlC family ABC transporter permease [Campylobacter sp. faydin G-140]|uniref:AzlC family ABC transporter permease n=1 Tax=Campylobacter anatolicus TaxID=2829105 RepID=UPI001B905B05|nr:AzlC family ABC transporter permease [Campylobacter anatolicus]MBR8462181.1 AzlC family ABC transporter permease [Campylobacter anatolicus]MBR8466386.1 AzlC family ABC transporter permease [Campylobacter anatolicus]
MSFLQIFKITLPIMMGWVPLGIAFGLLAKNIGVSLFNTMALSAITFAGAAQFMVLSLLSVGTTIFEIVIVSYLVNLRHTFYGLALLKEYKNIKFKFFNIFALTDESFALFKTINISDDNERSRVFSWINLLTYLSWVFGTAVGFVSGELIRIDYSGIEFCLTSLFIVLAIEMFKSERNFKILSFACLIGVLSVAFLPSKFMLLGAIFACFLFIVIFEDRL